MHVSRTVVFHPQKTKSERQRRVNLTSVLLCMTLHASRLLEQRSATRISKFVSRGLLHILASLGLRWKTSARCIGQGPSRHERKKMSESVESDRDPLLASRGTYLSHDTPSEALIQLTQNHSWQRFGPKFFLQNIHLML